MIYHVLNADSVDELVSCSAVSSRPVEHNDRRGTVVCMQINGVS